MNVKDSLFFRQAELVVRMLPWVARESVFALKGGTAINLFVQALPRLSVDIDLTYLPIASREDSLAQIGKALERIATSITSAIHGIKVQASRDELNQIIKLFVDYQGIHIKIEPNLVIRGSVFPTEERHLVPQAEALFEQAVSIQCLSIADLYGGKLCAALDRQHPRDLFDVHILMESAGISEEIRQAFVVYLAEHPRPINEILNPKCQNIRQAYERELLALTSVPIAYEDLVMTRTKLIEQLRHDLTDHERQFLVSIKEGQPRWELMNIKDLDKLPAIRWKLFNIHKMSLKKRLDALARLKAVLEV